MVAARARPDRGRARQGRRRISAPRKRPATKFAVNDCLNEARARRAPGGGRLAPPGDCAQRRGTPAQAPRRTARDRRGKRPRSEGCSAPSGRVRWRTSRPAKRGRPRRGRPRASALGSVEQGHGKEAQAEQERRSKRAARRKRRPRRSISRSSHKERLEANRRSAELQPRERLADRRRPACPAAAGAIVDLDHGLRRTYLSSGSSFTIASDRLSPPPCPRERAFSMRNSVASRGDSEERTEPSSLGLK